MTIVSAMPNGMSTQSNLNGEPVVELDGVALRWARIARLRQQIAAGTYHVPSDEVANRMIDAMMR